MRTSAATLALLSGLALALPALAADSTIGDVSSCSSSSDKKCVSDIQKRWQREQRDFERAQQKKLDTWRDEHPQEVSAEWEQARRAFSDQLRKEAVEFREAMKAKQKAFYDALKKKIPTSDSRLQGRATQQNLPGQKECMEKYFNENPEMYRLCLRGKRTEMLLKLRQQAIDRSAEEQE